MAASTSHRFPVLASVSVVVVLCIVTACVTSSPNSGEDMEAFFAALQRHPDRYEADPDADLLLGLTREYLYQQALIRAAHQDYVGLGQIVDRQHLIPDFALRCALRPVWPAKAGDIFRTRTEMQYLIRTGLASEAVIEEHALYWRDVDQYDSILSLFSDAELQCLLMALYYAEGDHADAEKLLQWMARARNERNETLLAVASARFCVLLDEPDRAVEFIEPLVAEFPENNRVDLIAGLAYSQLGNYELSLYHFGMVWTRNEEEHLYAQLKVAMLYLYFGRTAQAEGLIRRVNLVTDALVIDATGEPDFSPSPAELQAIAYIIAARTGQNIDEVAGDLPPPVDPDWLQESEYWPTDLIEEYRALID